MAELKFGPGANLVEKARDDPRKRGGLLEKRQVRRMRHDLDVGAWWKRPGKLAHGIGRRIEVVFARDGETPHVVERRRLACRPRRQRCNSKTREKSAASSGRCSIVSAHRFAAATLSPNPAMPFRLIS